MEPTPGKPTTKRRHRRLIAALVLVAASLTTWWFWPRGDQRFVGQWKGIGDPRVTVDLRSNGHAYMTTWMTPPNRTVRIWSTWSFDGQHIRVGKDATPTAISRKFWTAWNWLTGESGLYHEVRYRVDRIERDRLDLVQTANGRNGEPVEVHFDFERVDAD
jgi:hypothetical protein